MIVNRPKLSKNIVFTTLDMRMEHKRALLIFPASETRVPTTELCNKTENAIKTPCGNSMPF